MKSKAMELYHANTYQKKTIVVILILGKVDFRTRKIISDKEGHYIMIKRADSSRGHNNP